MGGEMFRPITWRMRRARIGRTCSGPVGCWWPTPAAGSVASQPAPALGADNEVALGPVCWVCPSAEAVLTQNNAWGGTENARVTEMQL